MTSSSGTAIRLSMPSESSEYDPLLVILLQKRGILTPEDATFFLNPDYDRHTHDPYLLKDMEKAVMRIIHAIDTGERIVIWSDYDCDGVPGAVMMHDFFKKVGYTNFENYIPHRTLEGFGLNVSGIEEVGARGGTLLITIDCGITDHIPVSRASELGIDVIITDHHLPHAEVPPAFAIINPKQETCAYPEKMLCGSGVIYKLIQGLIHTKKWEISVGWEKWLLDMAGIATLSDMVPLTGENRVFARYGLMVLRKSRRPGLQTLLRRLRIDQRTLTEDDIGFMIAPRINAASRMGVPLDAFKLLSTEDESEANTLAVHLDKINDERKGHVAAMVKEARHRLEALEEMHPVIVIGSVDWRPSLLGLVANNLMEAYRRPAFVWGRGEGVHIKGSCRSDGSVNVVTLMHTAGDIFIDKGGHAMSGGFAMESTMLHLLEAGLVNGYTELKNADEVIPLQPTDADLSLRDITEKTCRILDMLAPFGEGNPKPLFAFRGVRIAKMRMFGKEGNHLELVLADGSVEKKAIAFFKERYTFTTSPSLGATVDILGTIDRSDFGGRREIRLRLVDVR